jgi:hypothetical protein
MYRSPECTFYDNSRILNSTEKNNYHTLHHLQLVPWRNKLTLK